MVPRCEPQKEEEHCIHSGEDSKFTLKRSHWDVIEDMIYIYIYP